MSSKRSKKELDRLQQERERRAYLSHLSYHDALERLAERCDECGDGEGAFPRCGGHRPL